MNSELDTTVQDINNTINEIDQTEKDVKEVCEGSQNLEDHLLVTTADKKQDYKDGIRKYLDEFPTNNKDIRKIITDLVNDKELFAKDEKISIFFNIILSIINYFDLPGKYIISKLDTEAKTIEYALKLVSLLDNYEQPLMEFCSYLSNEEKLQTYFSKISFIEDNYLYNYFLAKNKEKLVFVIQISLFFEKASEKQFEEFLQILDQINYDLNNERLNQIIEENHLFKDLFTSVDNFINFQKSVIRVGMKNRDVFTKIIEKINKTAMSALRYGEPEQ